MGCRMRIAKKVGDLRTVARPELLDPPGDATFRRLLYDLFAFERRLGEARDRFARFIDLGQPEYLILIVVSQAGPESDIGIAQVAERLHLSGAFVTIEVGKLVKKGFLQKLPHDTDRRRVRLLATPSGLAQLARLATVQRPVNDALFGSLSRAEFESLSAIMRGLAQGADKAIRLAEHLTHPTNEDRA